MYASIRQLNFRHPSTPLISLPFPRLSALCIHFTAPIYNHCILQDISITSIEVSVVNARFYFQTPVIETFSPSFNFCSRNGILLLSIHLNATHFWALRLSARGREGYSNWWGCIERLRGRVGLRVAWWRGRLINWRESTRVILYPKYI